MSNPTRDFTGNLGGEYIMPVRNHLAVQEDFFYVVDQDETEERPQSSEVFEVPSSDAKVVSLSKLHNIEGSVNGLVKGIGSITAGAMLETIDRVLSRQKSYGSIWLVKSGLWLTNVVFPEGYKSSKVPGANAYRVTIPWIEVS